MTTPEDPNQNPSEQKKKRPYVRKKQLTEDELEAKRDAARKGGESRRDRGADYSQMGKKGGTTTKEKYPELYKEMSKKAVVAKDRLKELGIYNRIPSRAGGRPPGTGKKKPPQT